jgi:hypothetical protein
MVNEPPLVDRERERDALRRLAAAGERRLGVLYGRRQVGKTFLLSRTWERPPFYFLAADSSPELNRRDLVLELARWSGRPLDPADFPTWRTVFRAFVDQAREGPLVVVLDEFQYLLRGEDDVPSQLAAVWDREAQGLPITLVLSGSEVSTMENLLGGAAPLYGRADWSARLYPFDYFDAARMAPGRTPREAAYLYGVFGGVPRYLAAVRPSDSLDEAVVREFVSPSGSVHLQLSVLIEQEKGIRRPDEYRAVLTAVADGRTQVNEIKQAAGVDEPAVRRALRILEDMELVRRERNFGAEAAAPYRYYLADNAVRFWHRFVVPNRSRLATGDARAVWTAQIQPLLDDYMGDAFERMVAQAFARMHARWGLAGPREWRGWQGRDRNRRPVQIDVVAELDDGTMLTGEVKWSRGQRGGDLHADLPRDLADLGSSGYGWARRALRDGHFLHVSASGFEERFATRAAGDPRIHLVRLEDMY